MLFRCILVVAALSTLSVRGDVFGGAEWLRDPRMSGHPTINFLLRAQVPAPPASGPKNIHTLMRGEITLREKPTAAQLFITGDDYYKLSINGVSVVQGPEGGYDFAYPFYQLDVTDYLEAGENCLASHVFYQGLRNRVWPSADNRSGFIARLDVTYADATTASFGTDKDWRIYPLDAFPGEETIGYLTQFLEHIDMRRMPLGWDQVGYDDSAWIAPVLGRQDHVFVQQVTPPLQRYAVQPKVTKRLDDGTWFYDFGTEIVGHTRVQVQGEAGHVITVRHGEELNEDGRVRFNLRANMTYEERPVLSGNLDVIPFYDYRAFRYMEILNSPVEPVLWVEVRHHPFDATESAFTSSDPLLAQIFSLCKNTIQMGSQGGIVDCPTREKGQYLGDTVIAARSHLWLTGDPSLTKKALYEFYQSCKIHPSMMAVAPGHFIQEIAEFPLQYPLMLEYFYNHSGDRAFLEAMADGVFPGLFDYYATFENEAGLLVGLNKPEKWLVIDWPGNMRDGYDYPSSADPNTLLNGFYYGALRCAARLETALGRDGSAYDARADRVADAFAKFLVDPATGLYVDRPGSPHSSLHANAVPLAFGLTQGADQAKMLAFIKEKRLSCGVYIASYVIEACFRAGAPELGYALLTNDDKNSWKEMIRMGATTCLEVWSPDQKGNMSWCHPWATSPVYLIAEHVLGLTPGTPGWKTVNFAPPTIGELPAMTLTVPHPLGSMTVSYDPVSGYELTVPEGVVVEIVAPEGVSVRSNGKLLS